jgi:hypothetical protein
MESDHDILIRLDARLSGLSDIFTTFVATSAEDRRHLWSAKADQHWSEINFKDHEDRLRRHERYIYMGLGGLGTMQLIIAILTYFTRTHA